MAAGSIPAGRAIPDDIKSSLRRSHIWAAWSVLVLNILDLISTYYALQDGGLEGNPVAGFLIYTLDPFGIPAIIPLKLILCSFVLWVAFRGIHDNMIQVSATWFLFSKARRPPVRRAPPEFKSYLKSVTMLWAIAGLYLMVVVSNSLGLVYG